MRLAVIKIIKEFVGLQSKMYSFVNWDDCKESRTCEGVEKNTINKELKQENYKNTLFNNQQLYHSMKTIRSVSHEIRSYEINKVSMSCFDDKRYILEDGITSLAYGHKRI